MEIGERVQARILELDTNATEVARIAGLERTFVHDLISGRKKSITADALISLAKALQCLPEDLVGRRGEIAREEGGQVKIEGIIEANAWRPPLYRELGKITASVLNVAEPRAFVVHGDDAKGFGVPGGSAIIVDGAREPADGNLVVVERRRDELCELSIRRYFDEGNRVALWPSNDASAGNLIYLPSENDKEVVTVIGCVISAIVLFHTLVS